MRKWIFSWRQLHVNCDIRVLALINQHATIRGIPPRNCKTTASKGPLMRNRMRPKKQLLQSQSKLLWIGCMLITAAISHLWKLAPEHHCIIHLPHLSFNCPKSSHPVLLDICKCASSWPLSYFSYIFAIKYSSKNHPSVHSETWLSICRCGTLK